MTTSLTLVVVMAVLYAAGVYAMLERSLTRVLFGFLLLGNATNLLLLIVMGAPGVSPFYGEDERLSDPLPQALTLTAIVITFAVSAFLLALIYRSWQLGQADTVEDDAEDRALRERALETEDAMEDEAEDAESGDFSVTDFVGVDASPITVLGSADAFGIRDDAPVDRPSGRPRAADGPAEDPRAAAAEELPAADDPEPGAEPDPARAQPEPDDPGGPRDDRDDRGGEGR